MHGAAIRFIVKAIIQLSLETDISKPEVASVQRILLQIRLDQTEGLLLLQFFSCALTS